MPIRFLTLLISATTLSGCGSVLTATTSDVAGIAGAGVASAVTKSPTAAAGIGLGIAAGANAGLQYVERDVHRAEQDRIAQAAGELTPGVVGHWDVSHDIPIEDDEHGDLVVTRLIGSADFSLQGNRFLGRYHRQEGPTPSVLYRNGLSGWAGVEMGLGGAGNGAMGRIAVRHLAVPPGTAPPEAKKPRPLLNTLALFTVIVLGGCKAAPKSPRL